LFKAASRCVSGRNMRDTTRPASTSQPDSAARMICSRRRNHRAAES
jgi:hypothetical protein